MTRVFIIALLLWFPVQDLVLAYLYSVTGWQGVGYFRFLREAICLLVAFLAITKTPMPYKFRLSLLFYTLFILVNVIVGMVRGFALGLVVRSAGMLLLPVVLTLVGYFCHLTFKQVRLSSCILILVGVATTFFGFWEVEHTDFWTATVQYGDYLHDIKGVSSGYNPSYSLPWNFFGYEGVRRAAGLLSAPLAQGSFLVVVSMIALAIYRDRYVWAGVLLYSFLLAGVLQSGTRGAMLMAVIALLAYLVMSTRTTSRLLSNISLIGIAALVTGWVLVDVFRYTVQFLDGSSIRHLWALQENIKHLDTVLVIGGGVGAAGARASQTGHVIIGGGEGAIFSIAYQLGIPGAVAFIWFYSLFVKLLFRGRRITGALGEVSLVLGSLFVGVATSFILSEHILTFSGMGALWLIGGGVLRVLQQDSRVVLKTKTIW